ncbi:hypothetical protein [Pseudomonas sp.]|uniref:hypothetical protein n=1 Tax=Pseudomonas sp. TaxID=306 RepID=UPI0026319C1D|nr:hypothetical protein [Pseudomonas sp.]
MLITSAVSAVPLIDQGPSRAMGREQSVAQPEHRLRPAHHDAVHTGRTDAQPGKAQRFAAEVGKNLWFIPGMSNVLLGAAKAKPGLDGAISGALDGVHKTREDGFDTALLGASTGNYKAVAKGYVGAVIKNEATPESVKKALREGTGLLNLAATLRQPKTALGA